MEESRLFAKRTLTAREAGAPVTIEVRLYQPQIAENGIDWFCEYEIAWTSILRRNSVGGVDSIQAHFLALQGIGAELYAGRPSVLSRLTWLEADQGFGFPLPLSLRDLAVGEDKRL